MRGSDGRRQAYVPDPLCIRRTSLGTFATSTAQDSDQGQHMTTDGTHASLYDRRITLIVDALREDPTAAEDAAMSEDTARRLAARVLDALDYLPGSVRHSGDGATVASDRDPGDVDGVTDGDVVDLEICPACPHPLTTHDDIDMRFCRITVTRALSRGCSCSRK